MGPKGMRRTAVSHGYRIFTYGHGTTTYVHRAVAKAFIEKGNESTEVNHKDGNKQNNDAHNLEWCTRSYNLRHRHRVLGLPGIRGEKAWSAILTAAQVKQIRIEHAAGGVSFRDLGERYGVATPTIGAIIARRKWKHV